MLRSVSLAMFSACGDSLSPGMQKKQVRNGAKHREGGKTARKNPPFLLACTATATGLGIMT